MQIILASSSPYRKKLLARLGLEFECISPAIDESPLHHESPEALAARLARNKADAVSKYFDDCLILASDQVAAFEDRMVGKPGTEQRAIQQLTAFSGKSVQFFTSICLLNQRTGTYRDTVVPFVVGFRELSQPQIRDYVQRDRPLDCAGSFKWESLGIALFEAMTGPDITALEGLPLLSLVSMLEHEGIHVLAEAPI